MSKKTEKPKSDSRKSWENVVEVGEFAAKPCLYAIV